MGYSIKSNIERDKIKEKYKFLALAILCVGAILKNLLTWNNPNSIFNIIIPNLIILTLIALFSLSKKIGMPFVGKITFFVFG